MAITKAMKPTQRAGEPMESTGTKVLERGGLGVGFWDCSCERLWTCVGRNAPPLCIFRIGSGFVGNPHPLRPYPFGLTRRALRRW